MSKLSKKCQGRSTRSRVKVTPIEGSQDISLLKQPNDVNSVAIIASDRKNKVTWVLKPSRELLLKLQSLVDAHSVYTSSESLYYGPTSGTESNSSSDTINITPPYLPQTGFCYGKTKKLSTNTLIKLLSRGVKGFKSRKSKTSKSGSLKERILRRKRKYGKIKKRK